MGQKILVGPLLGIESDTGYTVCFTTEPGVSDAEVNFNGHSVTAQAVGTTARSAAHLSTLCLSAQRSLRGRLTSLDFGADRTYVLHKIMRTNF